MASSALRRVLATGLLVVAPVAAAHAQSDIGSNIRVLKLTDYLTAFYDGRPAVPPPKTDKPRTWVEYGSMDLGIATYVIHRGNQALVYDTFPTVQQSKWVRNYLEQMGSSASPS